MLSKNFDKSILGWITISLIVVSIYGCLWSILGQSALPPDGSIFALFIIFIISYLSGELLSLINLPPLLGMLITGCVFGNVFTLNFDPQLSSILRTLALAIILLRAGLGLDKKVLQKLSFVCLRFAFIPCIFEAATIALTTYLLLDFPLVWGFLLGFVLSGVSTAVIVPEMLIFKDKRIGTNKGIPTLVMASGSVDNVLALTCFGVFLGLAFDTGSSLAWNIIEGPLEAFIGLTVGCSIGIVLWYFPYEHEHSDGQLIKYQRTLLLNLSGIFMLFASSSLDLNGSGPLGCLTLAFVAGLKWRSCNDITLIESILKSEWLFLQPFLFSLIGVQVKLSNLKGDAIGYSLLALFIGLIIRVLISSLVVWGADLNIKEKLFVGFSWLPKATVQAVVGPMSLDLARERGDEIEIERATLVLAIAALSILITAPLGAVLVALTGPKLLNTESRNDIGVIDIDEEEKKSIKTVEST